MNRVSIISIGDEILIGQTLNTNAAYIGEKLTALGFEVIKSFVIGDEKLSIHESLRSASEDSEFIFITGGLGPTHDDITRDSIVEYFKTEFVFNESVLKRIEERFQKRERKMPEVNRQQAYVPKNATVIENFVGTAPGYDISHKGKTYFVMPGVPSEMKSMMENYIIPKMKKNAEENEIFYRQRLLYTTGIPESGLFELLDDINSWLGNCKLAFLPSQFGVKMRISHRGSTIEEIDEELDNVEKQITELVGKYIYSNEELLLEEVVGKILLQRKLTIAVAESCTGGIITDRITNISGSTKYFLQGVISYSNDSKIKTLGVNVDSIIKYGSVSEQVAIEMARGVRNISSANIGVSTTGIMGPTGATETKPIGLVYIGYVDDDKEKVVRYRFAENRLRNKERTSQAALELIRRMLLGIADET
ncbi:MAG: competence/damage-inducible protein A [Bacteroidetes bacterium]|nr:competence/damage-inducible protein A [Bacteroidota bacterium]MBU2584792.1 competence/damage-inducible protein A [Bacteroidota bacterium]